MSHITRTNGTKVPTPGHRLARAVVVGVAMLAAYAAPAGAGEAIVVQRDALEPAVLRATTGERVDFVNRTARPVHVEFAGDVREHDLVQIPGTGTIWVVFHRSGTHPYEVHVVDDGRERALRGFVEVAEGALPPVDPPACGVTVMGVCIER